MVGVPEERLAVEDLVERPRAQKIRVQSPQRVGAAVEHEVDPPFVVGRARKDSIRQKLRIAAGADDPTRLRFPPGVQEEINQNVAKLPNPSKDASAIGRMLKDAGFEVI